jgi:CheY-like chemotaxis protein
MPKIAIIDDATDNREFLYYLLRDECSVTLYESAEEALEHISHDPPDLIIMDIRLLGMDGTEALARMRLERNLSSVPVIAVTANAMLGDREKYLAAGFDEYIAKPIMDLEYFHTIVRELLVRTKPK